MIISRLFYIKLITNLWVGLQFSVERAIPVATDKASVLGLDRVLARNLMIFDNEY